MQDWFGVRLHSALDEKRLGFLTTRFRKSSSQEDAVELIMSAVRSELEVARPGEAWLLEVEKVWRCESPPEAEGSGFTWYQWDEDD